MEQIKLRCVSSNVTKNAKKRAVINIALIKLLLFQEISHAHMFNC